MVDIRTGDWSKEVSPFWAAVIKTALTGQGIAGLLKAGWTTIKVRGRGRGCVRVWVAARGGWGGWGVQGATSSAEVVGAHGFAQPTQGGRMIKVLGGGERARGGSLLVPLPLYRSSPRPKACCQSPVAGA